LLAALTAATLCGLLAGCGPNGAINVASFLHEVPQPDLQELVSACESGTPVPEAGPYSGSVHYVRFATYDSEYLGKPGRAVWVEGGWEDGVNTYDPIWATSDAVQLIVCQTISWQHRSCGTWSRSDGVQGEVLAGFETDTIKIVVAATGETQGSQVFTDPYVPCPSYGGAPAGTPPWYFGHTVGFDRQSEIDYIFAAAKPAAASPAATE
jgi:hypothetical protein